MAKRPSNELAILDVDEEFLKVFGIKRLDHEDAEARTTGLPNAYFNRIVHAIETSGALELIATWDRQDRKSGAGRKAKVSPLAVLTLFMLNAIWGLSYTHVEMAKTIQSRLTPEQCERIGIQFERIGWRYWKSSVWAATKRLRNLIDPDYQVKFRKKLTGTAYDQWLLLRDETREPRGHQLSEALVSASTKMLPAHLMTGYRGDAAIDGTAVPVGGALNRNRKRHPKSPDLMNWDFQCGSYIREGKSHDATQLTSHKEYRKAVPAYEALISVMIDTKYGNWAFPLITGLHLRTPSSLEGAGPAHVLQHHAASTEQRGIIAADREFNNYKPQHFQAVARTLGFHTAYDYTTTDLGKSVKVPGKPVILVDGWLYVDYMPEKYVKIAKWVIDGKIDPNTGKPYTHDDLEKIIQARLDYAMTPNGKLKNGSQEFKYPDPRKYLAFDQETGAPVPQEDLPRKTQTVTIGSTEDHYPIIKHLQHAPWHTEDWFREYHQRNQVEASNKVMKDGGFVAIGDKARRRSRGYAFNYLATIAATFATNLKRIAVGILKIADQQRRKKTRTSKKRAAATAILSASPAIRGEAPPGTS